MPKPRPVTSKGTNRAFSLLLAGSSASMLGSRVTTIAYPMLALYLTDSPVAAGWVACAATAPSIVCYLPAGAIVDRLDPKRLLMLSEFGRGVAITSVVAMVALGSRSLPLLIVAAVAEKMLEVFSTLAERRYVGSLIAPDRAWSALSRVEARTHVAVLVGRPLGGLLFELTPIAPFLFDAVTFAGSVGALGMGRRKHTEWAGPALSFKKNGLRLRLGLLVNLPDQPPKLDIKTDIGEGFKWLWHDRFARTATVVLASSTFISQALIIFFIAEARTQGKSSFTIGFVLAMSGLGGILGSALAARPPVPLRDFWIRIQMLAWSAAFAILAAFDVQSPWGVGVVMFIFGLTGSISNVEVDTYLIQHVPATMLARVTGICRLVSYTAFAGGPAFGGFLFEIKRPQDIAYWLIGATAFLAAYSMISPSMRIPEERDATAPAREPASVLEMILGWQLAGLAACVYAFAAFARPGYAHQHSDITQDDGALSSRQAELPSGGRADHGTSTLGRTGPPATAGAELVPAP